MRSRRQTASRRGAARWALAVMVTSGGGCYLSGGTEDFVDADLRPDAGDRRDPGGCVVGLASAQFRGQQTPPERMAPGSRADVQVSFDNCSGAVWRAGEVALVPVNDGANVWGVPSVPLSADVAPGARVTLPFTVQAPTEGGRYVFQWRMARGASESYQEPSARAEIGVEETVDCTQPGPVVRLRAQVAPPTAAGFNERVRGSVTLANCGAETWRSADGVALVFAAGDAASPWQTREVMLPRDVPFGAEVTLPIEGVAPSAPGRYPWAWALARRGERLGAPSQERFVTVLERAFCEGGTSPSRFVSQRAPTVLDPGEGANVDIAFANCGREVWDASYRINAAAPASDGRWGAGNLGFGLDVAPGFQRTVGFRITAPRDAGSYPYRWVVTRGGGADVPEPSPERSITVRVIDTAGPCQARPVEGNVTSPYGYRVHPITGVWRLHTGIDFGAPTGRPIRACRGGTVVRASWYGGYGNAVIVDHGGGMQTLYAHQSRIGVGVGQRVNAGDVVGYVGSTGNSTGPHLHFEVYIWGRTVDPARGYL